MTAAGSVAGALLAFTLVAGLLTITPGLDTVLVLRSTAVAGRRTGYVTGLGVCAGVLVWGVLSALGVSALLAASRVAFDVLRLAGAAYLVWLGAQALWSSRLSGRDRPAAASGAAPGKLPPRLTASAGLRRGLLTNLLNPKVGVFYVTLLPQFIPAGAPVLPLSLGMAAIHAVEGALWFGLLVAVVGTVRRWLESPRVARTLERTVGVVLLAFGLRLAAERL